jgi:EAL domain-containing protein (putative c-di-GMP-specific phosphodiesterase class I)
VTKAVITLGESMGMKVVAEGVEHPAQLQFLVEQGCAHAQGCHFAEPMTALEVPDFIERANFRRAEVA